MDEDLREVINEFLVESYEGLDRLDRDLVDLETDPSYDVLSSIFRTMHTFKGTCGFLGFGRLEAVTHAAENLLSKLRDGKLAVNRPIIDALLATVDVVRAQLAGIEATGDDPDTDHSQLLGWLGQLQEGGAGAPPAPAPPAPDVAPAPVAAPELAAPESAAPEPAAPEPVGEAKPKRKSRKKIGELLVEQGKISEEALTMALAEQAAGDRHKLGEILARLGFVSIDTVQSVLREQGTIDDDRGPSVADATIRVDVALLDALLNLIGELVLARNQVLQLASAQRDVEFLLPAQRLNLITSELQASVMKMRMQPIGSVWQRLPRVVRDLAVSCGKRVRLRVEGAETELDRTILEAIKDPLTHLVRNAIDHGIETPDVREARGKPGEGTLTLRAYHESGKVIIDVGDDGAGVRAEVIRAKATERGLVSTEQAARLSDREILNYIFAPGFSTAAQITNISGRGVGMDVVRTNIEKIGGTVELSSDAGRGTTIRIKIPLTLAIVPALVVLSRGQRYVIPQVNLAELVRVGGSDNATRIELIHGAPVLRLRGRLLPLIDLNDILTGGSGTDLASRSDPAGRGATIVVLHADDHRFGLVVDTVLDTQEIVVKPLGQQLKDAAFYAGATIMGDGKIALILDVVNLARRARIIGENDSRAQAVSDESSHADTRDSRMPLVVVDIGGSPLAMPLQQVARLEEIDSNAIELSRNQTVVQCRGEILTLHDLAALSGRYGRLDDERPTRHVVVHSSGTSSQGMMVNQILDIVHADVSPVDSGSTLGTAVIDGRVTDVVDLALLLGEPSDLAGV